MKKIGWKEIIPSRSDGSYHNRAFPKISITSLRNVSRDTFSTSAYAFGEKKGMDGGGGMGDWIDGWMGSQMNK